MIQVEFEYRPATPPRYVRLVVVRPMFAAGQPVAPGEVFMADVRCAGDLTATGRCKIHPDEDRGKVFKQVAIW